MAGNASYLVGEILKLCKNAKQKNIHNLVPDLESKVKEINQLSIEERSKAEETLIEADENGLALQNFFRTADECERDLQYQAKIVVFFLINRIKSNTKETHEKLAHYLEKSKVPEQAAKCLLEVHSYYQKDKTAGELAHMALLFLAMFTGFSKECAKACSPDVTRGAYQYLDPQQNHSIAVFMAATIIDRIKSSNEIHKMLFYQEFLEYVISKIKSCKLEHGHHSTMQQITLKGGKKHKFSLHSSLYLLNIILRSDEYRCVLHTSLLEGSSTAILKSVFKEGPDREKQQATDLIKQMCKHVCHEHSNKEFIKLQLTLVVGLDMQDVPADIGGLAGRGTSAAVPIIYHTSLPTATCKLGQRSTIFICDVLKIPEVFFNHAHNRCFCDECMTFRGDKDVYTRGVPPESYALPRGWFRFSLKLAPKATALDMFDIWHVAYHGTRDTSLLPILKTGELLMPGDETAETSVRPPAGHFDEKNKPDGFEIKQVFVTPSMKYSGLPVYAPEKVYDNPEQHGEKLSARVGFQVRIQPGQYSMGPETVGARARGETIDPHFNNDQLEWSTRLRGVVILTGVLVKV